MRVKPADASTGEVTGHYILMHAYMNFVVYCHIFQYICMLYNVISMFTIDFWGFTNDPLYCGYNSAEQENPVLCIFNFQEP